MIRPRIKGELVELRLTDSADLAHLVRWLNDPAIYRWWGGHPVRREEIQQKYTGLRGPQVDSYIIEESGTPVGYIQSWQSTVSSCGIDIFLDPARQGKGLGTDAVCALIRYLTEVEGRQMITADPATENVRALAMFRKAGFTRSGSNTDEGNPIYTYRAGGLSLICLG